jgi:hypothetical protein
MLVPQLFHGILIFRDRPESMSRISPLDSESGIGANFIHTP